MLYNSSGIIEKDERLSFSLFQNQSVILLGGPGRKKEVSLDVPASEWNMGIVMEDERSQTADRR